MVVVARLRVLLGLYLRHLPHLTAALVPCARASGTLCDRVLTEVYARLPSADFCRDLLASAEILAVYNVEDCGDRDQEMCWSGRP